MSCALQKGKFSLVPNYHFMKVYKNHGGKTPLIHKKLN